MVHNPRVGLSLGDVAWPVSTQRLTLRRATASDAGAVLSYRGQSLVSQWMGVPPDDFTARFAAPERLDMLLIVERQGAIIGDLMVNIQDSWAPPQFASQARGSQADLGWALRTEETGKGYATEAVEEVLRICFVELALHRVTARCFVDNVASHRLMERVGMRREARTIRNAVHPSGEWMDGYGYALLADEWRHRRA